MRRPVTWVIAGLAVVLLAGGLWAFQPWKAFTQSTVNEELPAAAAQPSPDTQSRDVPSSTTPSAPAEPEVLANGEFVDGEHETSGTARVLELAEGKRVLRLEGFSTSDGPDVHVWLSDQKSGGDWGSYDDGRYIPLGKMKATDGNQNYVLPDGATLGGMRSAVIWCDRFNVAFGSAPLDL
ncbi:MAG: hypothetical protein GEU98_05160 [Pseudonocardiaceae bacterium]|nr:hypothetical protein [Pseudonocardiaceae bacterium]